MSPEQFILESAIQELRGKIAKHKSEPGFGNYYHGRAELTWHCDGMKTALFILENMAYDYMQMKIETSQP